jgi:hypothetical protein
MRRRLVFAAVLLAVGLPWPHPEAVTVKPLSFDALVGQAAVIVHGRIVKTESYWRGAEAARNGGSGGTRSPERPTSASAAPGAGAPAAPPAPQTAGVEGGRVIFTRVTMDVLETVKGGPAGVLEFDLAGGTIDGRTMRVPGMPSVSTGREYVVFLRPGFAGAGDPILGVHQGFFPVAEAAGGPIVLDANFDFVVGVTSGGVLTRPNPDGRALAGRADRPQALRLGPPAPDDHTAFPGAPARTAARAPDDAPLPLATFVAAVRARLSR